MEVVRRALESVNGGQIADDCFDTHVEYNTIPEGPVGGPITVLWAWNRVCAAWRRPGTTSRWRRAALSRREIRWSRSSAIGCRGHGCGMTLDGEEPWAFWLRNGLIYRLDQYATESEALRAAGLES